MRSNGSVNIVQLISGLLFLLIGISIYALVRGDTLTYLPEALVEHVLFPFFSSQLTYQLPTFTHMILFALLTIALLDRGRSSAALLCLFWLFIEITFEVAHHTNRNSCLFDCSRDYFLGNSFDALNISTEVVATPIGYLMINSAETRRVLYKSNSSQFIATK